LKSKELFFAKSVIDQGLVSLSNFLLIIFSANLLVPQQHGEMSLILSSLFGVQMINLSLLYGGSFLYLKQKSYSVNYQIFLTAMCSLCALFFSLIFAVAGFYFGVFSEIETVLIGAIFIFFQLLTDHVRMEFYTFKLGSMPILNSILVYGSRLIGIYFVTDLNDFLFVLLFSNIFSLPRFSQTFSFNVFRRTDFRQVIVKHFYLSRHMASSSILNWGWNYLPIFFIGFYHDVVLAGILLSLRCLANIHNPLTTLLDTYVPSLLYRTKTKDEDKLMFITLYTSMGLWALVLIFLFFYSSDVLVFTYGNLYESYDYMLIILWISSGALIFGKNKVLLTRWLGKLSSESTSSFSAFAVVVIIGLPLIKFYALDGAVLLYLIATLAYMFVIYWKSQNKGR